MRTYYNLITRLQERPHEIPINLWDRTVEAYMKSGLLGEKHIVSGGRVLEGKNIGCNCLKTGEFQVFYQKDEERTIRQIVEERALTASGFDEESRKAAELGDYLVEVLEKADDTVKILSWGQWSRYSPVASMDLETPCGPQGAHIHLDNIPESHPDSIIQFWKPRKDKFWYDWDCFKDYMWDLTFYELKVRMKPDNGSRKRRKAISKIVRRISPITQIFSKILENPDFPDKVDFF